METSEHTFLFADLVGYTALTDSEGDDQAAAVALRFQDCARRLAAEHGVEDMKPLGDAVMLRCPQAGGAIQLGLRLLDAVEGDESLPPVRIGIHFGSAVGREGDWFGRGVNVAARLCSAAGGGEVLVSEPALTAAGELPRVEVGERRLHWLKNVTEPVPARPASPRPRPRLRQRWARRCPRAHSGLAAKIA